LNELTELMQASSRIVFFGGAGVSTESGIPDYRSEKGLYAARQEYGHSPEEMLSYSFFEEEPEAFYRFFKEKLLHPQARPNAAHYALARLEELGKLSAVITQNVDGLHQKAGSNAVVELHGSAWRYYCMGCGARYDMAYILEPGHCEKNGAAGIGPWCAACGGLVRPDVILYEEALGDDVMGRAAAAVSQADMMIIGGSSLAVYPAAGLVRRFYGDYLALINKTKTPYDRYAQLVIHDSVGKVLSEAVGLL
jgi:NAD-dependent deacetylase